MLNKIIVLLFIFSSVIFADNINYTIVSNKLFLKKDNNNKLIYTAEHILAGVSLYKSGKMLALYTKPYSCKQFTNKMKLYIIKDNGKLEKEAVIPLNDNVKYITNVEWLSAYKIKYLVYINEDLKPIEIFNIYNTREPFKMYNGKEYAWSKTKKYIASKMWIPKKAPKEYQSDFFKLNGKLIYPAQLNFINKHKFITKYYWIKDDFVFFLEKLNNKKNFILYNTINNDLKIIEVDKKADKIKINFKKQKINILAKDKIIKTFSFSQLYNF